MFRNHFKIALRNFHKHKLVSFVNLFGLTIGTTCCILILIYVLNELSYDKYNKRPSDVYRVTRIFKSPQTGVVSLHLGTVAPPFGPLLLKEFPQVEKMTRLLVNSNVTIRYKEKIFTERGSFFADENVFDIFKINLISGNAKTGLTDPNNIMLSREIARRYFGNEDPVNKVLRLDNKYDFKVTGVFEEFPENAHLHPTILLSFNTLNAPDIYGRENLNTNWSNNSFLTYLRFAPGTDVKSIEARLPGFLDKVFVESGSKIKTSQWTSLTLQKLTDIHLRSHLDSEAEENGDINRVYIFSAIAIFILLIACINYMNLSTARSTLRAKEIGIRKVVGAEKKEIILQFLSESVTISVMAMVLALLLTALSLPWLNKASGLHLNFSILQHPIWIALLISFPFVIGILSGAYPALFMSSFLPSKVLKGTFVAGASTISLRKLLVTLQFTVSIILIISTVVVFKQLKYMQHKSLGFDKDHIITTSYNGALNKRFDAFRSALTASPLIKESTRSSRIPSGRLLDAMGSEISRGDSLEPANADIKYLVVDNRFVNTYTIPLRAGRSFSEDFGTDTSAYVLNEAAVKALGLRSNQDALGKDFRYGGKKGKIIGVINDFHFESLMQKIVPLVFIYPKDEDSYSRISIKISGNDIPGAIAHIQKTWQQFLPETPFDYDFMDDNFAKLYTTQKRQGTIFTIFSSIAIFIACLGLFGLSSFTIAQRVKEIGIRKVLGASINNIVFLLSKDFLKLVLIAALIAFPIAWYAMSKWLMDFAYRMELSWWIFPSAAILAAFIAFGTLTSLTIKAATANPVKSLRSE